jgi:hypothetical protein
MQKFRVAIVAFTASAAILVPAGSVAATAQSASSPTTAAAVCVIFCFDLYEAGSRVGQDVDAMTAVNFCYGVLPPPIPIFAVQIGQTIKCPYQGHQRWIVRTR